MPDIVLMETWAKAGQAIDLSCDHRNCVPAFSAEACRWYTPEQVRERYPRHDAVCSACGQRCIVYASLAHLQAGGW